MSTTREVKKRSLTAVHKNWDPLLGYSMTGIPDDTKEAS